MIETTSSHITLKRPDRIVMGLLALPVVVALVAAAVWVVPILLQLAISTTYLVVTGIVLALLVMVLRDRGFWHAIYYKWANVSRNLRREVARENPVGTMDTALARYERKLEAIKAEAVTAAGARRQHQNTINDAKKDAANAERLLRVAHAEGGAQDEIEQYALAAQEWTAAVEELAPMEAMLLGMEEGLNEAQDLCDGRLTRMKIKRNVFKVKHDALMAGRKRARAMKSFFVQNDDLEMLQLSVEEVERQTAADEAEIDQFLRDIKPMVRTADRQKQADALAALERFGLAMKSDVALPAGSDSALAVPAQRADAVLVETR